MSGQSLTNCGRPGPEGRATCLGNCTLHPAGEPEPMTTEELVAMTLYVKDVALARSQLLHLHGRVRRPQAIAYWSKEQPEVRDIYRAEARELMAALARSEVRPAKRGAT